jgi:hypothetical protein
MSGARRTRLGGLCDILSVNNLAYDTPEEFYTLLGVRPDGVASVVDLVAAENLLLARRCATALLREHQSCHLVEVWRDGAMVDRLTR